MKFIVAYLLSNGDFYTSYEYCEEQFDTLEEANVIVEKIRKDPYIENVKIFLRDVDKIKELTEQLENLKKGTLIRAF